MDDGSISKVESVYSLSEDMSPPEALQSIEVLSDVLTPNQKLEAAKRLTIEAMQEKAQESIERRSRKGLAPKLKLSVDFGKTAYEKQLDTACTPADSLAHAASVHQLPLEGVMEVKNDKWPLNSTVVGLLENRFTHENTIICAIREESAVLASRATTINAGLNVLSRLQKLEAKVDAIQQENLVLKGVAVDHELRMEALEDRLSMEQMTPQQKAERLEKRGVKRTDIAKYLGVDRNTVARWLGKKKKP